MKKKAIISAIVMLFCIAATVGLGYAVNHAHTEYSEVKVSVVSSQTKQKRVLGKRKMVYEVIVSYKGQKHELENTHGTYAYYPGKKVTAYLSGGKLYANIEGVKTSTPLAKVYFGVLFVSFVMVIVTIGLAVKARQSA